jgi:hypothetical protein
VLFLSLSRGNPVSEWAHPKHMPRRRRPTREPNFAAKKPSMNEIISAGAQLNRTSIDFLKVDLQTALTFSKIALQSDGDAERRRRNCRNAHKAYDTIVRLAGRVSFSDGDARYISRNLERLKSELQKLGETF